MSVSPFVRIFFRKSTFGQAVRSGAGVGNRSGAEVGVGMLRGAGDSPAWNYFQIPFPMFLVLFYALFYVLRFYKFVLLFPFLFFYA